MTMRSHSIFSAMQRLEFTSTLMSECSRIIQPFGYKMPFRVIAENGAAERMILDTARANDIGHGEFEYC